MKIHISTKTGDQGLTSLANGQRVMKYHPRIVAVGELDELNSWLGLVLAQAQRLELNQLTDQQKKIWRKQSLFLVEVQRQLFQLGAVVALVKGAKFDLTAVEKLESEEGALAQSLSAAWQNKFVLPGGSLLASDIDLARAVCRRAERSLTLINATDLDRLGKTNQLGRSYQGNKSESQQENQRESQQIGAVPINYLNRLADYLYLLKRYVNQLEKVTEKTV